MARPPPLEGTGDHRLAPPNPLDESVHHKMGSNKDAGDTINTQHRAEDDLNHEHHRREHATNNRDTDKDGYRTLPRASPNHDVHEPTPKNSHQNLRTQRYHIPNSNHTTTLRPFIVMS